MLRWLTIILMFMVLIPRLEAQDNTPVLRHEAPIIGATFSKDGKRILSWSEDGTARIWDALTGKQILLLDHRGDYERLTQASGVMSVGGMEAHWSQDNRRILTRYTVSRHAPDTVTRIWDAETGEVLLTLPPESANVGAIWSKDETQILSANNTCREIEMSPSGAPGQTCDSRIFLWNAQTGEQITAIQRDSYHFSHIGWNQDETLIYTWGQTSACLYSKCLTDVDAWDTRQELANYRSFQTNSPSTSLNVDRTLLSVVLPESIEIWDTATGYIVSTITPPDEIVSAEWTNIPDSILITTPQGVSLWDAKSGVMLLTSTEKTWTIPNIYHSKGNIVLLRNENGVAAWNLETGQQAFELSSAGLTKLSDVSWNPDATHFVTVPFSAYACEIPEGKSILWDSATGKPLLNFPSAPVLAWSPDGSRIAFYDSCDFTLEMVDANTGEYLIPTSIG